MSETNLFPTATTVGSHFISNYPPFSCWTPEQLPRLYHALATEPKSTPLSLYVHLPFCRQRCTYCYFRVYPRRDCEDVQRYAEAVLRELALYVRFPAIEGRALRSVYFGGGTPSYLTSDQIALLIGGIQEKLPWDEVEECSFECEPGTVSPEKFQRLKQFGVTRLSLGFQSLNNDVLRRSGRDVTVDDCLRAFQDARAAGFNEINVDLLCGLPGETEATWRRTVDQVLELMPDCVTVYQLELAHNSKLYGTIKAGREVPLVDWPTKHAWTSEAFRMCEEAGYSIVSGYMAVRSPQSWRFVYTVDHFWRGADLLALGETSFGHIQGVHYQNADTFEKYTEAIDAGRLPVRRAYKLNTEEKLRRETILLLKTGALDIGYFRKKFNVELLNHFEPEFEKLLRGGFITIEGDRIEVDRDALLRIDCLLPEFYLPQHHGVRYT